MSGKEYMEQLDMLLRDIPHTERQEALKYYEDYFADAGPEREAEVIEELGSPEELAKKLREDLKREEGNGNPLLREAAGTGNSGPQAAKKPSKGYRFATVFLIVLGILMIIGQLGRLVGGGFGLVRTIKGRYGYGDLPEVEMVTADYEKSRIRDLDIEVGVCELTMECWDGDDISVSYPKGYVSVKQNGSELSLKTGEEWPDFLRRLFVLDDSQEESYRITVKVPRDSAFGDANIDAGAGTVDIERLEASNVDLDIGAGELTADEIIATDTIDIDAGAGEATIRRLESGDAEFDVGMGELHIAGYISGDVFANCGVGEITFQLDNRESDFNYSISCGVGEIRINSTSYSVGIAGSREIDNGAAQDFDMDCGVGEIDVTFAEARAVSGQSRNN